METALIYDLIVIGGGPAGTSAAITAARAGARVLLLERGKFPRHKVCGEFVSAESLGLLADLLLAKDTELLGRAIHISRARIFLDHQVLESPIQPAAASVARFDLDAALWTATLNAGVEARQQTSAQSITGNGPFKVSVLNQEIAARAVINGSGRWSNLNSAASENGAEKWIGIKGHFSEKEPPASVDLYFFQGGYCGVQPVTMASEIDNGRVNACAMVRAGIANNLPEVFGQHPALQDRSGRWRPLSIPVTTSPLLFRKPQPERDGILQVGDAAGFVDPFVGDGISLALRSGALAAQSLQSFFSGAQDLPQAARNYRQFYEQQLEPIFRMSSGIRRMLQWPRVVRKPIVSVLQRAPSLTQLLVRKTR